MYELRQVTEPHRKEKKSAQHSDKKVLILFSN